MLRGRSIIIQYVEHITTVCALNDRSVSVSYIRQPVRPSAAAASATTSDALSERNSSVKIISNNNNIQTYVTWDRPMGSKIIPKGAAIDAERGNHFHVLYYSYLPI